MGYIYIFGTLIFTVYGQMILKWRIIGLNFELPQGKITDITLGFFKFLFDPFILSGFASAFIASIFWTKTITKFETPFVPFYEFSTYIGICLSILIFRRSLNSWKAGGINSNNNS